MSKGTFYQYAECSVCLEEDVSLILYLPCGHRTACGECDAKNKTNICCLCRTPISERLSTAQPQQQERLAQEQQAPIDNSNNAQPQQQQQQQAPADNSNNAQLQRPDDADGLTFENAVTGANLNTLYKQIGERWRDVGDMSGRLEPYELDNVEDNGRRIVDRARLVLAAIKGKMGKQFTVGFLWDCLVACGGMDSALATLVECCGEAPRREAERLEQQRRLGQQRGAVQPPIKKSKVSTQAPPKRAPNTQQQQRKGNYRDVLARRIAQKWENFARATNMFKECELDVIGEKTTRAQAARVVLDRVTKDFSKPNWIEELDEWLRLVELVDVADDLDEILYE